MARFHGNIGFVESGEIEPGIYVDDVVVKRMYFGDVRTDRRRLTPDTQSASDDIVLSNVISIVADSYMIHHLNTIRFVEFNGICWKVASMEIVQPRVNLTLGGVWNGKQN